MFTSEISPHIKISHDNMHPSYGAQSREHGRPKNGHPVRFKRKHATTVRHTQVLLPPSRTVFHQFGGSESSWSCLPHGPRLSFAEKAGRHNTMAYAVLPSRHPPAVRGGSVQRAACSVQRCMTCHVSPAPHTYMHNTVRRPRAKVCRLQGMPL